MSEGVFESTNLVLLERLRSNPRDEAAWSELVQSYAPAIRRWCRVWRLQPADADDVTQTVLLRLARKMATFHYDPARSFRGYLKALTQYAVRDALEALRLRENTAGDPELLDWLAIVDTRNDLARCLEAELRRELFQEAATRVCQRIDSRTWEVFVLLTQEHRGGQEVADRMGMTLAAVYMAKSRVLKMMRAEVWTLSRLLTDPRLDPPPPAENPPRKPGAKG